MTAGPYLKFLQVQWVLFWQANPHLFTAKHELRDELAADRVLKNYRGKVIESAHAYGLWRSVLDFEDHWCTEDDQIAVGRFLTKAKLNPRRFALEEAEGLARAVRRFAVPPLHEWALDVVRRLDGRLNGDYEQEGVHDMIVDALAVLNCGPTRVQILMDEWYSRDLVTAEEHQFVTDFFANAGFRPPNYAQIRRSNARTIVVSEAAERASIVRDVGQLKAAREEATTKKAAKRSKKK